MTPKHVKLKLSYSSSNILKNMQRLLSNILRKMQLKIAYFAANLFFLLSVPFKKLNNWLKILSSVKGCLSSKVVFCQWLSSVKGRHPSKVVSCLMSSSVKGPLPQKVVFRQRCLSSEVVINQRSFSIKGHLPLKVVFHQR